MATLKQMQARLKKIQSEAAVTKRAQAVVKQIHQMMERHGLTIADLEAHRQRGAQSAKAPKLKPVAKPNVAYPAPAERHQQMNTLAKKGKLPAKYRNPKTGETWSGWARPPAWIANVKDRSRFLIDAEGNESVQRKKAAVAPVETLEPTKGTAAAAKRKRTPKA
jgi:DNA-binding protein H-NS